MILSATSKNNSLYLADNSFDVIRLIASLSVAWGHAVRHLRLNETGTVAIVHQFTDFFPGVIVFFGISGFLIFASLDRNTQVYGREKGLKVYTRSRFLRIYPALWVSVAVSLLAIALLYGVPPLQDTILWLAGQLTIGQFYTPESFRGYGVGAPNGSLWTIAIEVQFYIAVAALYPILSKMRTSQWLAFIATGGLLSVANYYVSSFIPAIVHKLIGVTLIPYFYIFLSGSLLYAKREQLLRPISKYIIFIVIIYVAIRILILTCGIPVPGTYRDVIMGFCVPTITIGAAYACGRHRLSKDFSYGVYIYHMIVINVLVELRYIGSYSSLLIACLVTCAFATVSWELIERPCLRLKAISPFKYL